MNYKGTYLKNKTQTLRLGIVAYIIATPVIEKAETELPQVQGQSGLQFEF